MWPFSSASISETTVITSTTWNWSPSIKERAKQVGKMLAEPKNPQSSWQQYINLLSSVLYLIMSNIYYWWGQTGHWKCCLTTEFQSCASVRSVTFVNSERAADCCDVIVVRRTTPRRSNVVLVRMVSYVIRWSRGSSYLMARLMMVCFFLGLIAAEDPLVNNLFMCVCVCFVGEFSSCGARCWRNTFLKDLLLRSSTKFLQVVPSLLWNNS